MRRQLYTTPTSLRRKKLRDDRVNDATVAVQQCSDGGTGQGKAHAHEHVYLTAPLALLADRAAAARAAGTNEGLGMRAISCWRARAWGCRRRGRHSLSRRGHLATLAPLVGRGQAHGTYSRSLGDARRHDIAVYLRAAHAAARFAAAARRSTSLARLCGSCNFGGSHAHSALGRGSFGVEVVEESDLGIARAAAHAADVLAEGGPALGCVVHTGVSATERASGIPQLGKKVEHGRRGLQSLAGVLRADGDDQAEDAVKCGKVLGGQLQLLIRADGDAVAVLI
jgi:hypothetical protein